MSQEKYCGKGCNAMITEMDEVKCKNTFDMIDASSLEPKTKADLKESVEEAKLNLNGRTLEERCASIARNQFDTTRLLTSLVIQSKELVANLDNKDNKKRTWKDVLVECQWSCVTLGGIIGVCSIFAPEIVSLLKAIVGLIH